MKDAYIGKDTFEISGIVETPDEDYILRFTTVKMSWQNHKIDEWYCCINDYDITEFAETKNFTTKEQ